MEKFEYTCLPKILGDTNGKQLTFVGLKKIVIRDSSRGGAWLLHLLSPVVDILVQTIPDQKSFPDKSRNVQKC